MTAILFILTRACLYCLHALVAWRAALLESRYGAIASVTEKLAASQPAPTSDWLSSARAQQKLLLAAEQVERAEARWHRTQAFSERLAGWKAWMAGSGDRSRAAWYCYALIDVSTSAILSERLGQHASRVLSVAMESVQAWL